METMRILVESACETFTSIIKYNLLADLWLGVSIFKGPSNVQAENNFYSTIALYYKLFFNAFIHIDPRVKKF